MVENLPTMSHAERRNRADEKAFAICEFLTSEVYSTSTIIADLLNIDRSTAVRTLKSLEQRGYVKSEEHYFEGRRQKIYGASPVVAFGSLRAADADPNFLPDYPAPVGGAAGKNIG